MLCTPNVPDNDEPEPVNALMKQRREWRDPMQHFVVVGGDLDWLRRFKASLSQPDVVVYCADETILSELGVHVVDAGWKESDPPLDLGSLIGLNDQGISSDGEQMKIEKPKGVARGKGILAGLGALGAGLLEGAASAESRGSATSAGRVYDDQFSGTCIGRVDRDGHIYDDQFSGTCVGRVDRDGHIYDDQFSGTCVGRVDRDGHIYDDQFSGTCIGRVDDADDPVRMGGGALRRLLKPT